MAHESEVDILRMAFSTNALRAVGSSDVVEVTLSLDTSAYASGDVLAATQEVTSFFRVAGGTAIIQGIQILDEDDQKQDLDILFMNAATDIGAENGAYAITDAEARTIIGWVDVAAADFTDFGDWAMATLKATDTGMKIPGLVEGSAASTSIWIGAICRSGTPTYTASGIKLKIGILRD